jgi:hypothetical protein
MRKTASEICAFEDRAPFPVEVPEWDMVGEDAAIVRQPDVLTIANIESSCDQSPEGRARRAARLIIAGCVEPKFTIEHEQTLMTAKSPVAIGRLVEAIFSGKKNVFLKL